jgi:hypothetical protein
MSPGGMPRRIFCRALARAAARGVFCKKTGKYRRERSHALSERRKRESEWTAARAAGRARPDDTFVHVR